MLGFPIWSAQCCPKRLDAEQTTKQYNRAKCGIPSTQTTSKRRHLFAAVQSARGHRVRGGGFERSEALTSLERRYDSGLCIVACVPRRMCANKASSISAPVQRQAAALTHVQRRARPLAHGIEQQYIPAKVRDEYNLPAA
jgi:hypothetical protein